MHTKLWTLNCAHQTVHTRFCTLTKDTTQKDQTNLKKGKRTLGQREKWTKGQMYKITKTPIGIIEKKERKRTKIIIFF